MNSNKNPVTRTAVLAGTAVALVLGGAVFGGSLELTRTLPAYAEPVQVQGVAPLGFADTVDQVRPAVVSVRVRGVATVSSPDNFFDLPPGSPLDRFFRQFRQDNPQAQPGNPQRPQTALGSGFFISEDGYVVTNNHVTNGEKTVTVLTDAGKEYQARVVGTDEKTDLALLKIDAPNEKFTYVKFSAAEPRVGDWVVAVGNPFGLGGTVTAGIISARGRQIGAGPYDDFLQIDAAVNRGNSGGPAFNLEGQVVGINTAIFSPSGGNVGIAFAIPASTARDVVTDLMKDGSVERGWLGVQIQPVNGDIADSLGLSKATGALVSEAQADSPAKAAGIVAGDVITGINGKDVASPKELARLIGNLEPKTSVDVTVWRKGASETVKVELGELPGSDQQASVAPSEEPTKGDMLEGFGMTVTSADDGKGLVVTDVEPGSDAAERGIQAGDVIVSVNSTDVTSPADVDKAIADASKAGRKAVLLQVTRDDNNRFVALPVAKG
jgi:serine protease Do